MEAMGQRASRCGTRSEQPTAHPTGNQSKVVPPCDVRGTRYAIGRQVFSATVPSVRIHAAGTGNRLRLASQKLSYTYFFEGLVRQCLLNYVRANSSALDASMSEQVFTFGSNMCSGRFRDYGVSAEGAGRAAVLHDYHLLFNKKSTADKSGKANVAAQVGSEVWGVLYTIPGGELAKLDKGEGGYRRVSLSVRLPDGTSTDAWVYVAKKPDNDPALRPYTWYKRFLVEGAREHSLPADYIARLDGIAAIQDTDGDRDRQKRSLACKVPP
jgi:gamma-glutamylcyclotransferase